MIENGAGGKNASSVAAPLIRITSATEGQGNVSSGFLQWGDALVRFDRATCRFEDGLLFIDAAGDGDSIALVGVPFPGAGTCSDLPGRAWDPDEDALAADADVLAEGGVWIEGRRVAVYSVKVECLSYNARKNALTLQVFFGGEDEQWGGSIEADGTLSCDVEGL